MESTSEVKGERKGTRPRGGRRGGRNVSPATPIHSKSDVKRFSYAWKKASLYRRWHARWVWAAVP